jgi:MFS superfamily sulfate permease-like transporter
MNNCFPSGDRELFALGSSNLVGAIFGGYVAYGSLPRSKIQAMAGARTPLTGLITAILVLTYFSLMGGVFQYLPKAALASVVFVAAYGLIEFDEIAFIFRMRKYPEIFKFLLTYFFTIFFDASTGILLCLLLAGLVIIRRSTSLNVSVLGEVKVSDPTGSGTTRQAFVDLYDHPEANVIDKLLALQLRGSLEFFNASRLARRIEMLTQAVSKFQLDHDPDQTLEDFDPKVHGDVFFIRSEIPTDKHISIVLDFANVEDIDSSAVWILLKIIKKSKNRMGSTIYFTGLHPYQLELFGKARLLDELEVNQVQEKVEDAIREINRETVRRLSLRQDSARLAKPIDTSMDEIKVD